MSEKPEDRKLIKHPVGSSDLREFASERDLSALGRYVQNRLATVMHHEPDGCLTEAMEFQGFTDQSVSFTLAEPHNPDDPAYCADAYRRKHRISFITLGILQHGKTFRDIGNDIEDLITGLPTNALQFFDMYADGLPDNVQRVPSLPRAGTVIDEDTRFARTSYGYNLADYRDHDLEYCIESIQEVQEKITALVEKNNAVKYAISVDPDDAWTVMLHTYKWDYLGRLKALLNRQIDIPGVQVAQYHEIPDEYLADEEDDFIATVGEYGEYANDYPPSVINELRSRLEMLREDYESVLLHLRHIVPADGGPSDGAVIEMYVKPPEH